MAGSAIQMGWSLTESSQSVFSVFRGVLAAATSDNVQVLAIMVCEEFGNTIAISNQTTAKVRSTIIPSPEPVPISFLKSHVGFFKDDCASQLGRSSAGTNFLGLAAALVTTIGSFNGAHALEVMLKQNTTDSTLLPTVKHLKDLLVSVEARSYRCGFADSVLGWQILLEKEAVPLIDSQDAREQLIQESLRVPSSEIIAGVVDAFRQVARMGSSTISGVTIKIYEAAAWILAFAQWCLEIPPSVYVEGIPGAICEQPCSQVKIMIRTKEPKESFELTIHHRSDNITHLIKHGPREFISGMVTIESYYPWLFRRLGFESDDMFRLLRLALEHAIPQVLSAMHCKSFSRLGRNANREHFLGPVSNSIETCGLTPLPDLRSICETYKKTLALDGPLIFGTLKSGMLVGDLPKVSRHIQSLVTRCPCKKCCASTERYYNSTSNEDFCYKEDFFGSLGFIITEILVLSLFQSSEPILVRASLERTGGFPRLDAIISKVIKNGDTHEFEDMDLLAWARSMIGHDFDDEDRNLILTSGKGQVIYPIILSTFDIEKNGYMKLSYLSGILRHGKETFNVISTPEDITYVLGQDLDLPSWPEVRQPVNLFKDFKLSWDLAAQDHEELHAKIIVIRRNGLVIAEIDPLGILLALRDSLLLERCPHDRRTPLGDPEMFASHTAPWCEAGEESDFETRDSIGPHPGLQINVPAVDGANDLRCLALAVHEGSKVLRRDSCLQCCLNLCRDFDIQTLIL